MDDNQHAADAAPEVVTVPEVAKPEAVEHEASKTVQYRCPDDTTGIMFSTGRAFQADEDGLVTMPDDLCASEITDLTGLGFVRV